MERMERKRMDSVRVKEVEQRLAEELGLKWNDRMQTFVGRVDELRGSCIRDTTLSKKLWGALVDSRTQLTAAQQQVTQLTAENEHRQEVIERWKELESTWTKRNATLTAERDAMISGDKVPLIWKIREAYKAAHNYHTMHGDISSIDGCKHDVCASIARAWEEAAKVLLAKGVDADVVDENALTIPALKCKVATLSEQVTQLRAALNNIQRYDFARGNDEFHSYMSPMAHGKYVCYEDAARALRGKE